MKKIVAGILILVLVLGLVACGGGGNDTNATRVENEEITLMIAGNERTGTYSGEVLDGVPHGEGVFTTYNSEGVRWTYTGRFVNGFFHGNGMTEWETGWREEGYYQYGDLFNGRFYNDDGDLVREVENGEVVWRTYVEGLLPGIWLYQPDSFGIILYADSSGAFLHDFYMEESEGETRFTWHEEIGFTWYSANNILTLRPIGEGWDEEDSMVSDFSVTAETLTIYDFESEGDKIEFVWVGIAETTRPSDISSPPPPASGRTWSTPLQTVTISDFEIIIGGDITWWDVTASRSDYYGRDFFGIPIVITNIANESQSLIRVDYTLFGPDGVGLPDLRRYTSDTRFDRSGNLRPGATTEAYLYFLYEGDGEYIVEFSRFREETVEVVLDIRG